jgi:hypothetical protein
VLVEGWRRVLRHSATVWLSAASTILYGLGGALFVFADDLGDVWFFALDVTCFTLAALCTAAIPFARIIRQKSLHDAPPNS